MSVRERGREGETDRKIDRKLNVSTLDEIITPLIKSLFNFIPIGERPNLIKF